MDSNAVQIFVFLALTAAVAVATWWKVRHARRDTTDAAHEFFLAGGTLSWPFIAGSLLLTNISAEQIVGMNGAQNMLQVWWEFGAAAGLLVLAHVLVPMYYKYKCTTTAELLEKRLGDPALRRAVSLLFLLGYMFILLPMVLYTGARFMQSMFQPDLSIMTISVLFALVGLAYAALGGLRGVAISDTYMGVVLLVMGGLVTFFALQAIGWDFSGIPAERLTLWGAPDSDIPLSTLFTGMVFAHIFYWGTNMVIAQRALAARNIREAQKGIYAAVLFKFLTPFIVVLPGIIAFKLYGDVDDVAYGRLVADVLPPWLSGAFAAAIAGAVLSSYNAGLNSAAALYTVDLHLPMINPKADARRLGQIVQVVFLLVSLALVPLYAQAKSIIATLQQLNGLYSMPVLAAFIVAIFVRGANARALRWALVFGVALYAVFTFVWTPLHYLHLMAITLVATIAFAVIGSRLLGSRNVAASPAG
ncbi:solute:sodium symporter family transporter [Agrilutibacter solisilvae]|uniref:Solute:sodium symporter family transporter n=1 Tax=Agrilutibacter solisilvae TaxID=2763317 RepID=A0A974Y647_9GAMM|nr:solute:sodium symporter family transporter [Lysobacter solisilvae]QSX79336.1 solute:sodium symporter family transporter [Lysobacter solisilvae]